MNSVESLNGNIDNDYPKGPELTIPRDDLPAFQIASFALTRRGLTNRVVLAPNPHPFQRYAHHPENPMIKIILPEQSGALLIGVTKQLIQYRNKCRENNKEITPENWQNELNIIINEAVISKNLQGKDHFSKAPNPYIPFLLIPTKSGQSRRSYTRNPAKRGEGYIPQLV